MDHRDFVAAENAAIRPVRAVATPEGEVVVFLDPSTARELAAAWSIYHVDKSCADRRPRWGDDYIQLVTAAGHADVEAGTARVVDPLTAGFDLRPVSGGRS